MIGRCPIQGCKSEKAYADECDLGHQFEPEELIAPKSQPTDDVDELRAALASDARFSDIPWVVVSMGAAGSVGFHNGRAFRAKTPDIPAVNATGSGDSTIAGFAHAIAAGADDETVLRTANTCGKLNAMDPMTGHLVMDRWDEVYNGVVVTEL